VLTVTFVEKLGEFTSGWIAALGDYVRFSSAIFYWILRGPGVQSDEYQAQDIRVYDAIGKVGETILPGYKYVVIWSGLYTTWGNELDWTYAGRGIISYSNELWTPFKYFEKTPERDKYDRPEYQFDRLLLMQEAVVPWTPVNHPQYGMIEVGGVKKQYTRAIPGFLLPAEAHRNMAFTVYQASQMPLVTVDSISTRPLGGGLTEVTAIVANKRLAPTHTQQDILKHITRPDWVALDAGDVIVHVFRPEIRELYQLDPAELWYNGGNLPDGCQIPSGMVGLRFKVIGSHTSGGSDHDLVANLLAIPNTTLNCPDLADKLIRRLHLTLPEPHVFGATQEDVE